MSDNGLINHLLFYKYKNKSNRHNNSIIIKAQEPLLLIILSIKREEGSMPGLLEVFTSFLLSMLIYS